MKTSNLCPCVLIAVALSFALPTASFAAEKNAEVEGDESSRSIEPDSPGMAWWRESMKTREQRLEWWREARFGMFVHWGVYAGMGGQWKDQKITSGYSEHIQRRLKIPIAQYRAEVAGSFNPTNFNADEWIRLAKAAGMGYFIITSKHHDGFAMWPSKASDYNIVDATPFKRDPMKELRAACRKHGVKFGFYYSHAFDWGEENGPGNDWDYKNPGGDTLIGGRDWWTTTPEFLPKAKKYVDEKSIPQLRELIKNYDPDIFWFDTPHKLPPWENARIMKAVREASPRVVINGRLLRGMGDYDSTADKPAEFPPHERDWEGIPTTNESYGWSPFDHSHKPAPHFVGLVIKAAARGGNILMNIGPMGDGRIDPKDAAILAGIADWWKVNGESIRGSTRTPLPVQAWGESTRKGNRLYLHVFDWPANGKLVVGGLKSDVKKAYLLSDTKRSALKVKRVNPLDVSIEVPAGAPDRIASVVVVECEKEPAADPARLLQPAFASDTLRTFDGKLNGSDLRFGAGKKSDAYVLGWTRKTDFVSWPVRLNEPATFDVEVTYDADANAAGGAFALSAADQTLDSVIKSGSSQTISLGRITLKPGATELRLTAKEIKSGDLMRPRSITLKTVMN